MLTRQFQSRIPRTGILGKLFGFIGFFRQIIPYGLYVIFFLVNIFTGVIGALTTDKQPQEKALDVIVLVGEKILTIDMGIYEQMQILKAQESKNAEGIVDKIKNDYDWFATRLPIVANIFVFYFIVVKTKYYLFERHSFMSPDYALILTIGLFGILETATLAVTQQTWIAPYKGFGELISNYSLFIPQSVLQTVAKVIT